MLKIKLPYTRPPTNTHRPPKHEDDKKEERIKVDMFCKSRVERLIQCILSKIRIKRHDKKPYILQLPDHMIVEIFRKLPLKTLIQCKCVCKSWRFLSDPHLTKDQFSQTPTCLLLESAEGNILVDLDNTSSPNNVPLKLPKVANVLSGAKIIGSCNGLLCLWLCRTQRFYISNPITGESLILPTPPSARKNLDPCSPTSVCGFGFSPINDVYKVVLVTSPNEESNDGKVMVLTVGSGIWRSIRNISVYPIHHHQAFLSYGVYLNGFIHWIGCSKRSLVIRAFDLESERFQLFPLPPCLEQYFHPFNLGVLRSSLSVLVPTLFTGNIVWMMKDYGVKESWTKVYEVRGALPRSINKIEDLFLKYNLKAYTRSRAEEQQLLLFLLAYSPRTRALESVRVDGIPPVVKIWVHIPSSVSLKDVIKG